MTKLVNEHVEYVERQTLPFPLPPPKKKIQLNLNNGLVVFEVHCVDVITLG